MLKQRLAIAVAAGALVASVGVVSALAENPPGTPDTTASSTATGAPADQQNGQQGAVEQAAANDVAAASTDVEQEAENEGPDDQSGDQQGPDDQSGEPGDSGQGG